MTNFILFKFSALAGFLWNYSSREKRDADSFLPGRGRFQFPHLAFVYIQGGIYLPMLGRGGVAWSQQDNTGKLSVVSWARYCYCYYLSPPGLYWHWHCFLYLRAFMQVTLKTPEPPQRLQSSRKNSPFTHGLLDSSMLDSAMLSKMIWRSKVTVSSLYCQASTVLSQVLKYANRNVKPLDLFYIHKTHTGIFIFSCGSLS